jgi:5-oxoprolinase (ATP-hydrolysing) subunit C
MIEIEAAGPLTLVQDLGRPGWAGLGIAAGGAMDAFALQRANLLLGNPPGAAALELVAGPLRLRAKRDCWLALAGAVFELRVDGRLQPPGLRCPLPAGALAELRGPVQGQYAVLAVDGGLALPPVLGAQATASRGGYGGLQGRALRRGDALPLGPARRLRTRRGLAWRPVDAADPPVGLLPGPEVAQLPPAARERFWATRWRLTPQSDRMGLRLAGEPLPALGLELLSHAVQPGLVQLPPSGLPIVLGADAQTTGGYPRLGQVIAADLWRLAQLRPGDALQFAPVDLDSARRLAAHPGLAGR